MVNIPASAAKTVFCLKSVFTLNGTDIWVALKNLRMGWSYAIIQETVMGSQTPIMATGEFRGTIEFEALASTDADESDWIEASAGQIATKSGTITETDTQTGSGFPYVRTWTVSFKPNEVERTYRENEFIRKTVRGILTTAPTEAVTP